MAIRDYRLDPFTNVMNINKINNERHVIPTVSPFYVRLNEIPQKTDPSTLIVKYDNGTLFSEVAAYPAKSQVWPDYNTTDHGIADWNTGTLQFNPADAGKTILVSYNGIGTLVDDRLGDMLDIPFTTSQQNEREVILSGSSVICDSSASVGSGNIASGRLRLKQHRGLGAGTYTLRQVLQELINRSQTLEFIQETYHYNCNCNCNCDCSDDTGP